ncbi:MAG: thiamine pyrophosphate protein central region [Actinobacteria bacterium]|nr:thiamine pyrophosphate protein central region [Actinomycetota bacterium]
MGEHVHGGRIIARVLRAEGIDALFTLTGGHISAIYDGCVAEGIRVVDVRHEQAATHAADAYARLTHRPGVAAVTAGPGLTDAITGVANAYYADSPVLLLAGRNPLSLEGMGALQDAPQIELLRPVTKRAEVALQTDRLAEIVGYALRSSLSPRMGPTFVDLPMDVLMVAVDEDTVVAHEGQRFTAPAGPDPDAVVRAVELLAGASNPVVLSGSGTYWARAWNDLRGVVEVGAFPLYVNSMSRGILPADHPNLLALTRRHALRNADVILALGIDFDFRLGYGRGEGYADDVAVIHVDPQADKVGHNRRVELGVVSDVGAFLRALLEHEGKFGVTSERSWLAELRDEEASRRSARAEEASSDQTPIHPLRFAAEVAEFVDRDAVLIGDGGDIVAVTAGFTEVNLPGHWMDPGPFGCLGVGAPFALTARLVRPDHQVVVIHGDGSFGFNGFEYESAARQGLPFLGVIGNDGAWGEMKAFHERVYGPEAMVAQDLSQETRYELVVEGLGGHGERVERPDQLRPALERADTAVRDGVPAVVNVILDRSFRRVSATAYGA